MLHNINYIPLLIWTLAGTVRPQPYPGPRTCFGSVHLYNRSKTETAEFFFAEQVPLLAIHNYRRVVPNIYSRQIRRDGYGVRSEGTNSPDPSDGRYSSYHSQDSTVVDTIRYLAYAVRPEFSQCNETST